MQPNRFEISAHLVLEPVSPPLPKSRRQDGVASLSMIGGFHRSSAPRSPPLCRLRQAAGIMQSRHAPPRARIGGLCLPLNSRKPRRAMPAAGETWMGARGGRETQLLGTQFPLWEGGDESGQRCGTGPCRTHEASDISTWELHTRAGTDSSSGSLERAITDPAAPWDAATPVALVQPIQPQSPPPRSGGVGFCVQPQYIPYQARVLGDWGWSLAGLPAVFG